MSDHGNFVTTSGVLRNSCQKCLESDKCGRAGIVSSSKVEEKSTSRCSNPVGGTVVTDCNQMTLQRPADRYNVWRFPMG